MAAKQLRSMEIEPAENGGHTITHRFKSRPVMRKGSMSGGMGMDSPDPETHVFGPSEKKKVLAHVAKHLGIQSAASQGTAEEDGEE